MIEIPATVWADEDELFGPGTRLVCVGHDQQLYGLEVYDDDGGVPDWLAIYTACQSRSGGIVSFPLRAAILHYDGERVRRFPLNDKLEFECVKPSNGPPFVTWTVSKVLPIGDDRFCVHVLSSDSESARIYTSDGHLERELEIGSNASLLSTVDDIFWGEYSEDSSFYCSVVKWSLHGEMISRASAPDEFSGEIWFTSCATVSAEREVWVHYLGEPGKGDGWLVRYRDDNVVNSWFLGGDINGIAVWRQFVLLRSAPRKDDPHNVNQLALWEIDDRHEMILRQRFCSKELSEPRPIMITEEDKSRPLEEWARGPWSGTASRFMHGRYLYRFAPPHYYRIDVAQLVESI